MPAPKRIPSPTSTTSPRLEPLEVEWASHERFAAFSAECHSSIRVRGAAQHRCSRQFLQSGLPRLCTVDVEDRPEDREGHGQCIQPE